jgi:hypothetical protein
MYCLKVIPFFLPYLMNAENLISSSSVMSKPALMALNNSINIHGLELERMLDIFFFN